MKSVRKPNQRLMRLRFALGWRRAVNDVRDGYSPQNDTGRTNETSSQPQGNRPEQVR